MRKQKSRATGDPPVHTIHVYATAPFGRPRRVGGSGVLRPEGVAHAKIMGTTLTACGQSALTWFKFYDLAFTNCEVPCSACQDALRLGRPAHWEPWRGAGPDPLLAWRPQVEMGERP